MAVVRCSSYFESARTHVLMIGFCRLMLITGIVTFVVALAFW